MVCLQPEAWVSFVGRDDVWGMSGSAAGSSVALGESFSMWTLVPVQHEILVMPDLTKDGR